MNGSEDRFSHDSDALTARTQMNNACATVDLATWVATHLRLPPDARLLDVGCGTGDQTLRLASDLGPHGRLFGLDRAPSSLEVFEKRSEASVYPTRAIEADMDGLIDPAAHPELQGLSHIVSVYALYYSSEPRRLLEAMTRRLSRGGVLAIVGPIEGNNESWFDLLTGAGLRLPDWLLPISETFMSELVQPHGQRCFSRTRVHTTRNEVRVHSADDLFRYWRSSTYRTRSHDEVVRSAIERHFKTEPVFVIDKMIGMIQMENPR